MPTGKPGKKIWRIKRRTPYTKGGWKHARDNPHRHKRMMARLILSLRKRLGVSQATLAGYFGVIPMTISRWEQPNGMMPRLSQFRRIRELWDLTKALDHEEIWKED